MPNFYNRIKALKFSTTADTAVEIGPSTSATPNFAIDAGGKLKWSSGSATADTTLYRTAANALKTDGSIEITTGLTAATPSFTGPLTSSGAATFSSSVTVTGDLIVNGTTTTVNSTTLTVDDKNIELGSVGTPTNSTADGGGITLKGATDKTIIWDNSATPSWNLSENLNLVSGKVLKINNTDVLTSSTILGASTATAIGASTGTTTVNNGLVVKQVIETVTTDTTVLSATPTNVDVLTSSIYYFTATPSANFALEIRPSSSSVDLNTMMSSGQMLSVTAIILSANAKKLTTININNVSQTINWFGGTAPAAGNTIDLYSISILKTGTSTYKVFASQAKFA
jgi:hypothetical protein